MDEGASDGLKGMLIGLCCLVVLLILYGAQLPQYGDSAIGTFYVYAVAFVGYALLICLSALLSVHSLGQGSRVAIAWPAVAIVVPAVVWLSTTWLDG